MADFYQTHAHLEQALGKGMFPLAVGHHNFNSPFISVCVSLSADPDDECELPEGEAGIVWDAICFTVLLAQRRVFLSYYFLYVVSDLKSSKILASRSVAVCGQFNIKTNELKQEKKRRM